MYSAAFDFFSCLCCVLVIPPVGGLSNHTNDGTPTSCYQTVVSAVCAENILCIWARACRNRLQLRLMLLLRLKQVLCMLYRISSGKGLSNPWRRSCKGCTQALLSHTQIKAFRSEEELLSAPLSLKSAPAAVSFRRNGHHPFKEICEN